MKETERPGGEQHHRGNLPAKTMNRQPYYHRATILFTGTRAFTEDELSALLRTSLEKQGDIVAHSTMVEEFDEPEPGDPADLL